MVAEGLFDALAGHHLHTVARQNVVAHAAYIVFVARFAGFVFRLGGGAAQRQWNGHALAQGGAQGFQAVARDLVAVGLGGVGINNQINFTGEVVDHRQLLRQHQQHIGQADGVGFVGLMQPVGDVFEVINGFVAEIAHQPAGEAR